MAFQQRGGNQVQGIYAKFNASSGKFFTEAKAGDEGAIEYTVTKGPNEGVKRYRHEHSALLGKLTAVTLREDNYMNQPSLDVNLAFADPNPGNPTIVVTARLMGGENGAVYQATLGWLESLNKADLSKVLDISVANNPAGSKFMAKDKDGKEVEIVREFASSTVFTRYEGAEPKDFIADNRKDRPAAEEIFGKDKTKVIAHDYTDQLAYAKAIVSELAVKAEVERNRVVELMKAAHQPMSSDDSVVFGGAQG